MSKKFSFVNNKGGVTKTTTAVNISYGLARVGRRVLIVDTDAQSNTTYSLTGSMQHEATLFDVLFNGARIADVVQATQQDCLDLVPGSINLSAADLMMAAVTGRERKLQRALKTIEGVYDYILIDTPPNLGVITVNALVASDAVIIPIALTTYALIGIGILEATMQDLRENMDVELPVFGVVANLFDYTNISGEVLNMATEHFGELMFQTVVPRNIKVEEAHNRVACIYDYAPLSKGALAYSRLVQEVITRAES